MKYVLGAAIFLASVAPALATPVKSPAPDLATGIPAVLAVVCAFSAAKFLSRK